MTLEEAEAKILELEGTITTQSEKIVGLEDNAGKLSDEELKKIEQKSYNQGFDKAKNQFDGEKANLLNKDDVEKMLSDRDHEHNVETQLLKMGIKSPKKALKIIDEEDFKTFGTDSFKADDFKNKYSDVLVFKDEGGGSHTPILKDNRDEEKPKMTAEQYSELSKEERMKVDPDIRASLI